MEGTAIVTVQNLEACHILIEYWAALHYDSIDWNWLFKRNLQVLHLIVYFG